MARNIGILERHLQALSVGYTLSVTDGYDWVHVQNVLLPPGFNLSETDVLIEMPRDYPLCPPGIGTHTYVSPDLQFNGRQLRDVHAGVTPGWGRWAWLCYQSIHWDPHRDDLVTFMEMVRADLTNPPTR